MKIFNCYVSNKNVMVVINLLAIKCGILISDTRGHSYKIIIKIIQKEIKFWFTETENCNSRKTTFID